jgi:hypothetical protein
MAAMGGFPGQDNTHELNVYLGGFVVTHAAAYKGAPAPVCGEPLPLPFRHGIMRAPSDVTINTVQGGPPVPFISLVTCQGCAAALNAHND